MDALNGLADRRTSADVVFEALHKQIASLEIVPGTKLSEAEIAKRFGLSRQPIREAFSRLNALGLITVRLQRPTIVRHFSLTSIKHARLMRTAVELEVLRLAVSDRDSAFDDPIRESLAKQRLAVDANDPETFHQLDYDFHRLLCCAARREFVFETIASNKAQVDRPCMLSLTDQAAMEDLYGDHLEISDGILEGDARKVETSIRCHLDRLTPTIERIHDTHRNYFEE